MGRADNLSVMGLYTWDNTLFDLFQIPEELEHDVLLNNLLAETMELEVLYPNPTVFKTLIGVWSSKQLPIWERLYATTQYEYNPIENYNRYETGSETGGSSSTHSGTDTHTDTLTHGGEDVTTGVADSAHWIAGFNATPSGDDDGLKKQSKDSGSSETRMDYGHTETKSGSLTHGEKVVNENEGEHELHAHGNIGVTTTQKLIREQREVDKFNLYDIIIKEFKERFCVLVY